MKSFALAMLVATAMGAGDFVFDYETDGTNWGDIEGAEVCGTGTSQSPINLPTDTAVLSAQTLIDSEVDVNWYTVADENIVLTTEVVATPSVVVGDHTVKVVYNSAHDQITTRAADWTTGEINDWYLAQFHFHWMSEHEVDGARKDFEVHFVHFNAADPDQTAALVLGVMFSVGDTANPLFEQFDWTTNPTAPTIASLDLQSWLNGLDMTSRWNYQGSLTTPPCTEIVNWNVLTEIQTMTQDQLDSYKAALVGNPDFANWGNSRVVQELGDRTLVVINSDDLVTGLTTAGYEAASLMSLSAFAMASTFAILN